MKTRTTTVMAVMVALTALVITGTGCSSATPLEQATGLIDEYMVIAREGTTGMQSAIAYAEQQYASVEATEECDDDSSSRQWSYEQGQRYDLRHYHGVELHNEVFRAEQACFQARRQAQRVLQELRRNVPTEEMLDTLESRLVVRISRIDENALEIILAGADSDADAWASLMRGIGNEAMAEWPTDEVLEEERVNATERMDNAIEAVERTRAEFLAAQSDIDATYEAIRNGTWEGRSELSR